MPARRSEMYPLNGKKAWGFLEKAQKIRLATVVGDEAIKLSACWFVTKGETIYVAIEPEETGAPHQTPSLTHGAAMDAGGRVSGVVDGGDEITNFHAVNIEGKGEKITDEDLRLELLDLLLEKYFYHGHPHLEHFLSAGAVASRGWYRLIPDTMEGWDRREAAQAPIDERRVLPPHLLGKA